MAGRPEKESTKTSKPDPPDIINLCFSSDDDATNVTSTETVAHVVGTWAESVAFNATLKDEPGSLSQPVKCKRPKAICATAGEEVPLKRPRMVSPSGSAKSVTPLNLTPAPVFKPTPEEFKNPMKYIRSITAEVKPHGICKIIPPDGWSPAPASSRMRPNVPFDTLRHDVHKFKRGAVGLEPGRCYTAATYRNMAMNFESKWRATHPEIRTTTEFERTFWDVVESGSPELSVEYGANLDNTEVGSGFSMEPASPRRKKKGKSMFPQWNLNFFGHDIPGSVLGLVSNGDIPGVTRPWMYLGMLFASFAWHVEDNHLFSINYMHEGKPKSWYGVPADHADAFEEYVSKTYKDASKDILRGLSLWIAPASFLRSGVKVVHTLQEAGHFIVTMPRAYHSGFSHGFNIGEAVNFATVDWVPAGVKCCHMYHRSDDHESTRHSVINCDLLMYRLARAVIHQTDPYTWKDLPESACSALQEWLCLTVQEDLKNRKELMDKGVKVYEMTGSVEDEEFRECKVCKVSSFAAVLICSCKHDQTVCLRHKHELCSSCTYEKKMILSWFPSMELQQMVEEFVAKRGEHEANMKLA